jgi:hypothetical protein
MMKAGNFKERMLSLILLSLIQGEHISTLKYQNYTEKKCGIP